MQCIQYCLILSHFQVQVAYPSRSKSFALTPSRQSLRKALGWVSRQTLAKYAIHDASIRAHYVNCLEKSVKSKIKALCSKSMLLHKGAHAAIDGSSFEQISTIEHQYYLDCYIHAFLLQASATLLQLLVCVYTSFPRLDNQQHVWCSDWCHLLSMLAMLVNRLVCESRL